ncbi:MAG: hypothetical protein IJH60_00525 [Eubacterium sp.]|nr:hypothetical protein [Eubacterium sp.]
MRKTEVAMIERENDRLIKKEQQMLARQRKAEKMLMAQERKRRTRRLILIGATVESALGYPVEEEMLDGLKRYLIREEGSGRKVSRVLKED